MAGPPNRLLPLPKCRPGNNAPLAHPAEGAANKVAAGAVAEAEETTKTAVEMDNISTTRASSSKTGAGTNTTNNSRATVNRTTISSRAMVTSSSSSRASTAPEVLQEQSSGYETKAAIVMVRVREASTVQAPSTASADADRRRRVKITVMSQASRKDLKMITIRSRRIRPRMLISTFRRASTIGSTIRGEAGEVVVVGQITIGVEGGIHTDKLVVLWNVDRFWYVLEQLIDFL